METKDETTIEIVTIGGKKYLTFPQAYKFIGIERGALQQQANRNKLGVKKIGKYVFVPYEKCEELKNKSENLTKAEKLQELATMGISIEEIQEMIEEKKKEAAKGKKK